MWADDGYGCVQTVFCLQRIRFFTTKDFDYQLTKGKKAGNWNVKIDVKDKRKQLRYILNIYNNGKADLIVNDFSRQSIRFQGEI